ncbi:MAG: hypothetical protein KAI66_04420, partial [Lentisphaeria bacterium]|nr:hypothetical protein [Lentisphaeria bacterium]
MPRFSPFVLVLALPLVLQAQLERVPLLEPAKCVAAKLELLDARISTVDGALDVRFGHDDPWPHAKFDAGKAYALSDWSSYQALSLTISNPLDKPVKVNVRIDDSPEANGTVHCRQGGVMLAAGANDVELRFELTTEVIEGMRGQPRRAELDTGEALWIRRSWPKIDFSHITAFQIFMARPQEDFAVRVHKVELLKSNAGDFGVFVDRYGQFTDEEWPNKVHSDADLAQVKAREEKDLAAHPRFADRNAFGGWNAGPQLEATGRFRVAKHGGKWWFVDPEGRLFWSAGITCVRPESNGPMLGRERHFAWLPEKGSPLAEFYSTRGKGKIDFGKINLYRKFGKSWRLTSHELAARRLVSWGFNTIGNWSSSEAWDLKRVPYTIPVHYRCPRIKITKTRSFPDVFGEEFEPALRKAVEKHVARAEDPWLLGVFIDNEMPWAGWGRSEDLLPFALLDSDTPSATRKAMGEQLRAKYGVIAKLNEAWGTALAGWESFDGTIKL